jgi:hypothetical protein
MKRKLSNVTLLGLDCINIERLKLAADICQEEFEFGAVKLLSSIPDSDPRVIPVRVIDSIEKYSHFFIKEQYLVMLEVTRLHLAVQPKKL